MKNKLRIVTVTLLFIVVSSCSNTMSESKQIQKLNKQVVEQQKQIDQLKRAIASSTETNSTGQIKVETEDVISSQADNVGWKEKQNWQKIQDNMSSQQVITILGRPTRQDKLEHVDYLTLFWEGNVQGSGYVSGNILFSNNLHDKS